MVKKKVNQEDKQRTSRETSRRLRKGIGSETRCWTGGQEVRKKKGKQRSKAKGQAEEYSRRREKITTGGKAGGQAEAPSSKSLTLNSKTRRRKSKGGQRIAKQEHKREDMEKEMQEDNQGTGI